MLPRFFIQLLAVAHKEIRHTVRDRRMMAVLLLVPVVQLGIFGFAVDFDVDRVPTVVVDHDHTEASRHHLERILADGTLLGRLTSDSETEARQALDEGQVSVALIVPRGFGETLGRGQAAHMQVVVDGTDPNRGAIAAGAVARYAREDLRLTIEQMGPTVGRVAFLPRVLYNPRLRTAVYMVPGIIGMLLAVITVIVTAMGLARERETGTLEQVMVTPMSAVVLLTGKLLPYVFIGLFDFLLAVTAAVWIFGVPLQGPLSVAFLGTAAYLVCTLGIGLLVSTISRTQQQAFIGGFLFLMPAILLSGVMTPLWGVPWWIEPLVWINPVKYYVEIVRGVLLRGAGLEDLQGQILTLAGMGLVVLTFAALRFKRTMA
jgi:ABC-2 type transport system permease protein